MTSILSAEKRCFICGTTQNLHRHHIYHGANRKISERWGCWVYLCYAHHNGSNMGVHFNSELDRELQCRCQEAWEAQFGSREDFRKTFGRSFL